jgi:hypothetical protein
VITDPGAPGYRYPQPGEVFWHEPWRVWIRITGQPDYGPVPDEVAGEFIANDQPVVVKLRSLREKT